MSGRPWTEEEIAIVHQRYPHISTAKLAHEMGCSITRVYQIANKSGIHKTAAYLASPEACRLRRGDEVGKAYRFKPGQVPSNKGMRRPGWAPGRMRETQFKKGARQGVAAKLWCPIGTIRPDAEGYLRVKVREWMKGEATGFGNTKIWPLLQRYTWEQHHGPVPVGHTIVFKDRNRANCDIGNLECISRRELMLRNSSQRWGKEVFEVIQLRGALNRKLRKLSEKQDSGLTQPSL